MYTAAGWGGNPRAAAVYVSVIPTANDGKTVHRLTVGEVPVDGFWSISVYNAKGFFEKNALDSYSLNNLTAKRSKDGSITVQFGGCSAQTVHCLVTPRVGLRGARSPRRHGLIAGAAVLRPAAQCVLEVDGPDV